MAGDSHLAAQVAPSVQQDLFRSQWAGAQVDQIPSQTSSGLSSLVGSLQTRDQVQRQVDSSLANLKAPSPFVFHPSLGLGWQASTQANQSVTPSTSSGYQSSAFASPSLLLSYLRDHGPWTFSSAYSVGYRYYFNPNYSGAGTGYAQNPLAQSLMGKAVLDLSRFHGEALVTASSGGGYDITSASSNLQTAVAATLGMKYLLSSSAALAANAGYSLQNAYGSTATPNNNTSSSFGNLSSIYDLTTKTKFSFVVGAGSVSQGLQQGTAVNGNVPLTSAQNVNRVYGQGLANIDYHLTGKLVFDVGLGARYVSSSVSNASSQYVGLKPSWVVGLGYTPTPKTSLTFSSGEQAADVTPEFGLSLSWKPREKTQVTLSLTQTEQFANALAAQYVLARGISTAVQQQLSQSLSLALTGGYSAQNFVNLSTQSIPGQSTSQLPSSYYYASLSATWKIRPWASLVNSLTANTGQQSVGNQSSNTQPQYLYSISLNLAL